MTSAESMKAIVYTRWGPPDVLQLLDRPTPTPAPNQVLVQVCASSVNAMEWRPFTLPRLFIRLIAGWREPRDKSLGVDLAGRVAAVGSAVTQFRAGDEVFGLGRGAFAEYICTTEDKLARKPANVSFESAATVGVAAFTALQAVRDHGRVRAAQTVLINGAGGGVGTFAIQIAKSLGANVTAVCSARTQDVARALGADHVIDYTREDVTRSGQRYDVVIVANGQHSLLEYRRVLAPKGRLIVLGGALTALFQSLLLGPVLKLIDGGTYRGMLTRPNHDDLVALQQMLANGIIVPAIDRSFPLERIVEAIAYLIAGHARGKVVIRVSA